MKRMFAKTMVCFMLTALLGGVIIESSHASETMDCRCYKGSCRGSAKACVCSHRVIQTALPECDTLALVDTMSYFPQNPYFTYRYLSARDIFHPPKVSPVIA